MTIPYRTRQAMRRFGVFLLVVIFFAVLCLGFWLVWLNRFIVYTRDGIRIDFSLSETLADGTLAVAPETQETIDINYDDPYTQISNELYQLGGYYVETDALQKSVADVKAQIEALPKSTPIMIDVKNRYGSFYYSSRVGTSYTTTLDVQAMDELIAYLAQSSHYIIARVPALRDYTYGLHHVPDGLPTAGGYLWMDSSGYYWLNPMSSGTLSYLMQIANELKSLGFDEVVFDDFCFPETDKIVYTQDKEQALATAANTLVSSCASDIFAVSFVGNSDFSLPEGRTRLYAENIDASDLDAFVQKTGLAESEIRVVFLTQVHDTRYDKYGVLRPLSAAH